MMKSPVRHAPMQYDDQGTNSMEAEVAARFKDEDDRRREWLTQQVERWNEEKWLELSLRNKRKAMEARRPKGQKLPTIDDDDERGSRPSRWPPFAQD